MAKHVREKCFNQRKDMSGDKLSPCDNKIIKSMMGGAFGTHGKQEKCK